jgi:MYXO-CTERM domain-containing protein
VLRISVQGFTPPAGFAPVGLLGNANGDPEHDLAPRGGQPYTLPLTQAQFAAFGESWRVQPGESLFDDVGPPVLHASTPSFEPSADMFDEAAKVCATAGIEHAGLLKACVVDVAATGDPGLAQSIALMPVPRAVLTFAEPTALGDGGGPPAPSPPPSCATAPTGGADKRGALILAVAAGVAALRRRRDRRALTLR